MSNPCNTDSDCEIIPKSGDYDETIVAVTAAAASTTTTTTTHPSSTTSSASTPAATTSTSAAFRLPDGQMINSKNTLQSFVVAVPPSHSSEHGPVAGVHYQKREVDTVPNDIESDHVPIHAEAVPEQPILELVDVDLADSSRTPDVTQPHTKTSSTGSTPLFSRTVFVGIMILVVVVVVVAVGVGGYCGAGNCGGTSSTTQMNGEVTMNQTGSAPESSPPMISNPPVVAITPTLNATYPPTVSPIAAPPMAEQLSTACHFLNYTNITVCQRTTRFRGRTMGNTIPAEIGLLTRLTYLDFTGNADLTGTIPSTLGNLTELTWLGLNLNQLTGTIPSTLGDLTQLTSLYLNYNQLTGTIPSTLGNLRGLRELSLNDNQLSGPIPSTFGTLIQITNLALMRNQLSGTIPSSIGNLTRLHLLSIYENQFTGTIPMTMGNLTQLAALRMYNNIQLTGTIPATLCSVSGIDIYIDCFNIMCRCCKDSSYVNCSSS